MFAVMLFIGSGVGVAAGIVLFDTSMVGYALLACLLLVSGGIGLYRSFTIIKKDKFSTVKCQHCHFVVTFDRMTNRWVHRASMESSCSPFMFPTTFAEVGSDV